MINIREVKSEDVESVENVFYKTWLKTYPNKELGITENDIHEIFKNSFTLESLDKRKLSFKNMPKNSKFFVAEDNNTSKVVGVCRVFNREEYNQLQAIYILPEFQKKGIGKMLWEEAKIFFDTNKKTLVQVATYNTNAIKFYKNLGFKDNGKRFSEEKHRMPISKVLIPEMEMEMEI